jgi:Na+-driven multidrug efflux pump
LTPGLESFLSILSGLCGKEAMGAVAVSISITLILIGILSGSTTATSILVSQYYGVINGHRKTIITMLISIVSLIIIRIPLAYILHKTSLGLTGIWVAIFITYWVPSICGIFYCLKMLYSSKCRKSIDLKV